MDRNEAIKVVKSHYPANKQMLNEALEFLIPELAESEDERIRKELIKHLKEGAEGYIPAGNNDDYQRWLAWLEKQGEQKRQMPLVKSVPTDFKDRLGTFMQYTSVDLEKEENKQLLNEAAEELLQLAYSDKANEIALASAKTWEEGMAILIAANNAYDKGKKEQKPADYENANIQQKDSAPKFEPKFKNAMK